MIEVSLKNLFNEADFFEENAFWLTTKSMKIDLTNEIAKSFSATIDLTNEIVKDFRTTTKNFCEAIKSFWTTIDLINEVVKNFRTSTKSFCETIKNFRLTKINVDVFANDSTNEIAENFRFANKTTTFVKDFRFATTTNFRILMTTKNFKRSKNTTIICMIFSYFFINSTTSFNFDKLRQSSYFDSYSRQRMSNLSRLSLMSSS